MNIKRIMHLGLAVAGCIAITLLATSVASAQTINWQVHNILSKSVWEGRCNQELADQVAKDTNGQFQMHVYPSGSSGIKGADILDAVSDNLVQQGIMWGSHVAGEEQVMELFDLPLFVPADINFRVELWKALESDFRALLQKRYNVYLWHIAQESPRMIYTKNPVKDLASLHSMKIRAMGPVETTFTQDIGAQAVPVAWTEVYTALQQGMIDGNWVADLPQYDAKLYEVTNYIYDIGNAGAGNFAITSMKALNDLPKSYRDALMSHKDIYAECAWKGTAAGTAEGRRLLQSKGMKVVEVSAKDRAFMLKQAGPIIQEWVKRLDPESLKIYEKAKSMIDGYKAKHM